MIQLLPLFFKVGLFTVGGGLAAIPLLHELVISEEWMSSDEFLSVIAVSESTPGSIGVNMATFVGVEQYGIPGGILATFSLVLPSLLVITSIARFFPSFTSHSIVQGAFHGIRPAIIGLIGSAAVTMGFTSLLSSGKNINISAALLFLLVIFLHDRFKWPPVFLIVLGAFCGAIFL